jgi:hypothetical protein
VIGRDPEREQDDRLRAGLSPSSAHSGGFDTVDDPRATPSDRSRAARAGDYARTDGHRLRRVEPVEHATRELGALVRARTDDPHGGRRHSVRLNCRLAA